jgi:hypothetical protein
LDACSRHELGAEPEIEPVLMTAQTGGRGPVWSRYLQASWWRQALPGASPRWLPSPVAANEAPVAANVETLLEQSGVFERPVPVPRAALLVLRAGVISLLLGRIGWLLIPASPVGGAGGAPAELSAFGWGSVGELLGRSILAWLLAGFYAVCVYLVARVGHATRRAKRAWLHDGLMLLCCGVLLASGVVDGAQLAWTHAPERLATALLPLVWVLTRRNLQLRSPALALARLGVVLAFLAHGLLFLDWRGELPLLGRLLVTDLELGNGLTNAIMFGLGGLYVGLGSLIALGGWLRRLDHVLLGIAVTLGAFTAGIRICLGLEPGFFQASAAHWLLSTLLGSAVGCLPLFIALCADQRLVALGAEYPRALAAQAGPARRPGPLSAA